MSLPLQAQHQDNRDETSWWPGSKVVLWSGDTVSGSLTLYRSQDLIYVQQPDGSSNFYTPVHVQYFITREQLSGKTTLFRTLSWDMGRDHSDFKKPAFFEQLNEGSYTLMRREMPLIRNPNAIDQPNQQHSFSTVSTYTQDNTPLGYAPNRYYMLLPNGEVVTLRNLRKDLHRLFGKKSRKVKSFVKKHNLDYEYPHRLVAIVNYYNSL
ncbi:hypothetical protein MKJ04_06315 [Pontibacter sp. E15-1]|uniref:hypothetical protein n=1 Tax=Pontibacter sp. E15-1 TaxID=2919918 RepID=UPI001F4F4227|nr:hypothetical protein [Pontibacter sp. E15-1]MCJ8164453.1 hypothetical protein [Pontibacter sp. E15-1]